VGSWGSNGRRPGERVAADLQDGYVKDLTLSRTLRKVLYMTNIEGITDPEDLLDAIEKLSDEAKGLNATIKAQTIRAVHHLGARRVAAAAAAAISRPTLNAWLDEYAERAGDEWDVTGS